MRSQTDENRQKLAELVNKIWRRKQSRWPWPTGYLRAQLPRTIYAATKNGEPMHDDNFAAHLVTARLMANGTV
ncbi:hypothetical protein GII36_00530 [Candidatus Mycosynbacter amalyticus]|uniref:Uncharacterized protein n=1 Tax=Candidatus Mycosynbacter amalyticus TaxID=2665156 RepID=A0A857MIE8_9BACT|nr:hypothetical protein [Candidatus Mycosynbacter amalyticus]QHN42344.1 hypothetical protein GII36_00530 [Candidatus Mycosynbacter amalyticus]